MKEGGVLPNPSVLFGDVGVVGDNGEGGVVEEGDKSVRDALFLEVERGDRGETGCRGLPLEVVEGEEGKGGEGMISVEMFKGGIDCRGPPRECLEEKTSVFCNPEDKLVEATKSEELALLPQASLVYDGVG